tara:strand:+ start:956 stop:1891 length:936 start_codon:yes stop_codon:yes gene_type:complete
MTDNKDNDLENITKRTISRGSFIKWGAYALLAGGFAFAGYKIPRTSDPENKITESSEDNNRYNELIDVPKAPFFELICNDCTAEQKGLFYNNALEDYRKVLEVYGIKEEDVRTAIHVGETQYVVDFYFGNKVGTGVEMGHDNFTTDRRGMRHSIGHAINDNLFPTYHMWFDEGLAMYASGEVETAKTESVGLKEPDDSLKLYKWDEAINLLTSNPDEFWGRISFSGNPNHMIGQTLYMLLDYYEGLTLENNRTALEMLADTYAITGTQPTKALIQEAYGKALRKNLDHVFGSWLKPGVMKLYTDERIRSEF